MKPFRSRPHIKKRKAKRPFQGNQYKTVPKAKMFAYDFGSFNTEPPPVFDEI